MTDTELFGWHFTREDGTTSHLRTHEVIGTTYRQTGKIAACINGLHGSLRAIDALYYAYDTTFVRYCRFGGEIVQQSDKLAASERTPLYEGNVKSAIQTFAYECADRAVRLHAPAALRLAGMETEAVALESLSPIVDITTADTATDAAYAAYADAAADAAKNAARAAAAAADATTYAAIAAARAAIAAARVAADAAARAAAGVAWRALDVAAEAANAASGASRGDEQNWQNTRLETLLRAALNMPEVTA